MRWGISWPLVLILATLVHIDWHFARPLEYRLSLGWSTHWLFGIACFAMAGWYIGRRLSNTGWKAAAWNVGLALFVGQGLEPVLEAAFYDRRFGYPVDSERWAAFWEFIGAGLPALVLTMWWLTVRRAASQAIGGTDRRK